MIALRGYARAKRRQFVFWSMLTGWSTFDLTNVEADPTIDNETDLFTALRKVNAIGGAANAAMPDGIFTVMWPHFHIANMPPILALIAEYSRQFAEQRKRMVLVLPMEWALPPELENSVTFLDFDPPTAVELKDIFERVREMSPPDKRPNYSEEEVHRIIAAGQGTEAMEFENAISRAIITHRDRLPNLPVADFSKIVLDVKTEAVRKSEVLEVMPTSTGMAEVGGLDNLKTWVRKRRASFTAEAREFGVDKPRGFMLAGPPGCLHSATVLQYNRGKRNSGRPIRLDEFYRKFNRLPASGPAWSIDDTRLHSYDPATGRVLYNNVSSVVQSGIKALVRVQTDTHGQVTLTADHPVLIEDGTFVPAGLLQLDQRLLVKGCMQPSSESNTVRVSRPRVTIEALKFYPSGSVQNVREPRTGVVYSYRRTHRARLVVEADMNNMTLGELVARLKHDPSSRSLRFLPSEYEVHHIDEDAMNDALSNLVVMEKADHTREHSDEGRFNVRYTGVATVTGVSRFGNAMTYDVQVAAPASNYAVNDGIIVRSGCHAAQ